MPVRSSLSSPLSQFCLTLETFRRSQEGRVRSAKDFLDHFFPHDAAAATDRVFSYLPPSVRGPVLTAWGLRGTKTSLRDTDEKIRSVLHDALLAGDIDAAAFEEGLDPTIIVRHVPLADWWALWRGPSAGTLPKHAILKTLVTACELSLFDAKWFWDTIARGELRGTDVVAEGLSKADLTEWLRAVHKGNDGSPRGLFEAIGIERIVARTPDDALLGVIDALAKKHALVAGEKAESVQSASVQSASVQAAGAARTAPAPVEKPGTSSGAHSIPKPPDSLVAVLLDDGDDPTSPPQPRPELRIAPTPSPSSPAL